MNDERWNSESRKVVPEVGRCKRLGAFKRRLQAGLHGGASGPLKQFGADRVRHHVDAEEVLEEA